MKSLWRLLKLKPLGIGLTLLLLALGGLPVRAETPSSRPVVDFMGSSTIQFWESMETDFPQIAPVNLGVWGSDFSGLLKIAPSYLHDFPAQAFVIYSGDNDIANGISADQVLEKFTELSRLIQTAYPEARILVISIKPCPVSDRRIHIPEIKRANALLRDFAAGSQNIVYVDVFNLMLDANGEPRAELFREDGLHLNEQGYALWARILARYF